MTETKRSKKQSGNSSDEERVDRKKPVSSPHKLTPSKKVPIKIDVFVLRHGEAGNRMGVVREDSERPLSPAGRIEMEKIAKSLKKVGLQADRIYSSPLRRARETAEIAARVLKVPILEEWDELKPEGSREGLFRKLARLEKNARPILVGHEPYLSSMIGEIIGTGGTRLVLKKGGLAKVRITSFTPRVSGELRCLLTPKIASKMS